MPLDIDPYSFEWKQRAEAHLQANQQEDLAVAKVTRRCRVEHEINANMGMSTRQAAKQRQPTRAARCVFELAGRWCRGGHPAFVSHAAAAGAEASVCVYVGGNVWVWVPRTCCGESCAARVQGGIAEDVPVGLVQGRSLPQPTAGLSVRL